MIYNSVTNITEETNEPGSKDKIYNEILKSLIKDSGCKEIILSGCAGTGKTTLVSKLITEIGCDRFIITAVSHKAVNVLKNKIDEIKLKIKRSSFGHVSSVDDILAKTLTSLLDKKPMFDRNGNINFVYTNSKSKYLINLYSNKILVVDEYSMIDDVLYSEIKQFADYYKCKILFVGDKYQCPPPTNNLVTFSDKIKTKFELKNPVRYSGLIQSVATLVRDAIETEVLPSELINQLKIIVDNSKEDSVVLFNKKKDFIENSINKFKENNNEKSILCYKNETVANINKYVKSVINQNKDEDIQEIKTNTGVFFNGDKIMIDTIRVDVAGQVLGSANSYNLEIIKHNVKYRTFCVDNEKLIVADETLFYDIEDGNADLSTITAVAFIKYYEIHCINRSLGNFVTVKVIDKDCVDNYKRIKDHFVKMKSKTKYDKNTNYQIALFLNAFDNIIDSYCINVYKAQGSTYDEVSIYLDDILSVKPISLKEKYRAFYTAITRASKKVNILI